MEIQDRIIKVIEYSGLSRSLFSKKIGVHPQTTHHIVSGRRTKPSFDVIEKIILAFPEINSSWLITGKGELSSTYSYDNTHLTGENVNKSNLVSKFIPDYDEEDYYITKEMTELRLKIRKSNKLNKLP